MTPTAIDVLAARRRIRHAVRQTPLIESAWLAERAGADVRLKLESVQVTGSFKIRGALNALTRLAEERRGDPPHIVTASAGNHGRAIALAAQRLGMRATVFTPRDAPAAKTDAIRRHGADLRQESADYDAAEAAAQQFARETGARFVSPYNHPDVVAGAGTIALEVLESCPHLRTIVVPIGGAGLISGIALAIKTVAPGVRVVGVEAEASCAFLTSLRAGRITLIDPQPTIADGLGGNMDPDTITFGMVQQYVDEVVTVSETDLMEGMRGLVREEHLIAEGAGAAASAAVLAGLVEPARAAAGPIVALVSGGNVDVARLLPVLAAVS